MRDRSNKDFWERFAGIYGKVMNKSVELYSEIIDKIKPELSEKMKVLEIGCGTGQLSFDLCGHVSSYLASDFSSAMIEECRKKEIPEGLTFEVIDACSLPFEEDSFDVVIIANTLHIMPEPEKALREIKRVLKKDGLMFAPTFINGKGFFFLLRTTIMSLGGFKVFFKWTSEEFCKFVSAEGFKIIRKEIMGGNKLPLCYLEAKNE